MELSLSPFYSWFRFYSIKQTWLKEAQHHTSLCRANIAALSWPQHIASSYCAHALFLQYLGKSSSYLPAHLLPAHCCAGGPAALGKCVFLVQPWLASRVFRQSLMSGAAPSCRTP